MPALVAETVPKSCKVDGRRVCVFPADDHRNTALTCFRLSRLSPFPPFASCPPRTLCFRLSRLSPVLGGSAPPPSPPRSGNLPTRPPSLHPPIARMRGVDLSGVWAEAIGEPVAISEAGAGGAGANHWENIPHARAGVDGAQQELDGHLFSCEKNPMFVCANLPLMAALANALARNTGIPQRACLCAAVLLCWQYTMRRAI